MIHSFPHRMVAVPVRILLGLFTDPVALIADVVFYLALTFTLWGLWLLIVHVKHWIARHVRHAALDREYAALCDAYSLDGPCDTEKLPGVTHVGPAAPPPVRRPSRRRRRPGVRIPRRRVRNTTTSSSDRSFRS